MVYQAWWGMMGLGNDGQEWALEEKFERLADAGFEGILGIEYFSPVSEEAA